MIRINLLPVREIRAEIGRRQELIIAGASVGMTVVILLALYLFQSFRLYGFRAEAESLKTEIATLNAQLTEVGDLQQQIKALRAQLTVIEDLSKKKVGPVKVMESLSSAVPPRLWLTEFKEAGGNVSLSGLAIDNQTVADFLKALGKIEYFNNVELVETTQVEQDRNPFMKFSVRAQLFYQPPPPAPAEKASGSTPAAPKEAKKN